MQKLNIVELPTISHQQQQKDKLELATEHKIKATKLNYKIASAIITRNVISYNNT